MDRSELLDRHVAAFNHGVRTGDYEPMLAGFAGDAELIFEGPPVGPYVGLDAIRAGYAAAPPDDTLRTLASTVEQDLITARYAWDAEPDRDAGVMILELDGELIRRLTVRFGP